MASFTNRFCMSDFALPGYFHQAEQSLPCCFVVQIIKAYKEHHTLVINRICQLLVFKSSCIQEILQHRWPRRFEPRDIIDLIFPRCPGSDSGSPPIWKCLKHIPRRASRGHPCQMGPFGAEEQLRP